MVQQDFNAVKCAVHSEITGADMTELPLNQLGEPQQHRTADFTDCRAHQRSWLNPWVSAELCGVRVTPLAVPELFSLKPAWACHLLQSHQ